MTHESTRTTRVSPDNLDAAALFIPEGMPFFMLNLLRYKAAADYPAGSGFEPCSGRDAYHHGYVAAFTRLAAGIPIEIAWLGGVLGSLVAPAGERWDELALVRYPTFAAFRSIVASDRYAAEAAPHRLAALEDWRLLATTKLG